MGHLHYLDLGSPTSCLWSNAQSTVPAVGKCREYPGQNVSLFRAFARSDKQQATIFQEDR
jgi:hypothetical protein